MKVLNELKLDGVNLDKVFLVFLVPPDQFPCFVAVKEDLEKLPKNVHAQVWELPLVEPVSVATSSSPSTVNVGSGNLGEITAAASLSSSAGGLKRKVNTAIWLNKETKDDSYLSLTFVIAVIFCVNVIQALLFTECEPPAKVPRIYCGCDSSHCKNMQCSCKKVGKFCSSVCNCKACENTEY